MVPRPVLAVLMLFPITAATEAARKQGAVGARCGDPWCCCAMLCCAVLRHPATQPPTATLPCVAPAWTPCRAAGNSGAWPAGQPACVLHEAGEVVGTRGRRKRACGTWRHSRQPAACWSDRWVTLAARRRCPLPSHASQTIGNACGTIGLLHSLANNADKLDVGELPAFI